MRWEDSMTTVEIWGGQIDEAVEEDQGVCACVSGQYGRPLGLMKDSTKMSSRTVS